MNTIEFAMPDPRWFHAPHERTPQFFRTYAHVSMALQTALRQMIPTVYFENIDHFQNEQACYVLLAYGASRPFRPKSRTDFTYDVTNPHAMRTFYRYSRRKLIAGLACANTRLIASAQPDLARQYPPRDVRHVLKMLKKTKLRKSLHRLLRAEGSLVNELMAFSGLENCTPKQQRKRAELVLQRWRFILRRAFLPVDLRSLAEPLFEVATTAYLAAVEMDALNEPDYALELFDLAA